MICVEDEVLVISQNIVRLRGLARKKLLKLGKEKFRTLKYLSSNLDHPNLHRILDMAFVVLPMVGHMGSISELMFEKVHQAMETISRTYKSQATPP